MRSLRSSRVFTSSGMALILALGLSVASMSAHASQSRVTLVATIENRSALVPGKWLIFKISDLRNPITTLTRHSGTVYLPAGQYKARVELNHKVKETNFRVESDTDKLVTVAMD